MKLDKYINPSRTPITRFSEFYKSLLDLESKGVEFKIDVVNNDDSKQSTTYIDIDYILNADDDIKRAYVEYRQCWYDMKDIGIEVIGHPLPNDDKLYACISSSNMQLITMFHAHINHMEQKESGKYDEDMYKAQTESTLRNFNVKIEEYIL